MSAIYAIQPVTGASVAFILGHLWDRGQAELKDLDVSLSSALVKVLESVDTPGAVSGLLTVDGVPVAAAGITPDDDEAVTWFLVTDDFEKHAKIITKMLRKYTAEYSGVVTVYSTCSHPDTARWFRTLGFIQDADWQGKTPTGRPMYRFRRK